MSYTRYYRRKMRRGAKHPIQQRPSVFSSYSDGTTSGINTIRTIESISDPSTYMSDGLVPNMNNLQNDIVHELSDDGYDSIWGDSTLASSNAKTLSPSPLKINGLEFLFDEIDILYNQADDLPTLSVVRANIRLCEELIDIAAFSKKENKYVLYFSNIFLLLQIILL